MTTISVRAVRRPRVLGPGIALLGAVTVLSPYRWHSTWRGTGFAFDYVPFHLWCLLPFLVLAFAAPRLGRLGGPAFAAALVAGTVATVELTNSYDDSAQRLGLALPGLLALAVIGAWGLRAHPRGGGKVSRPLIVAVVALLALVIVGGRVGDVGETDRMQTFLVIGTSIALEALPFVLLGAAVSAAIEIFVPSSVFERIARLPLPLQIPQRDRAERDDPPCLRPDVGRGAPARPQVVPIVALAYLSGARGHKRAPSIRELGANGLLVAPILLTLMVPAPSLGALAVENKRTKNVAAPLETAIEGDVRLYEIAWAAESKEYADYNELAAGTPVDFVAFVSNRRNATDELEVSRFMVGCCAADANAFSVMVTGAPDLEVDTWVQVQGKLTGTPGKNLKVAADAVTEVAEPANPYS